MTSPTRHTDLACSVCGREDGEHSEPLVDTLAPLMARFRDTAERRESLAILKALRLARSLEDCESLLRGERIPRSRLDPEWLTAYGV